MAGIEHINGYTLKERKSLMWSVYDKDGNFLFYDFYSKCFNYAKNNGKLKNTYNK